MSWGLHWLDSTILAVYAGAMIGLGWWVGRRPQSADDYFVGGRRMNPILVGVSIFATLFSTISYLTIPGEVIKHGPLVSLVSLLAIPIYYYIIAYWMLPFYMEHRSTSAYALLEDRLGLAARMTGATMFVLLRLMWMAVLIFLASKALLILLRLEDQWLPAITLSTGAVAICYSSMGGLRAVVVTDAIQSLLLFIGAVLIIVMVTRDARGFDWIPTRWNQDWDHQPLFALDPAVRVTVFGSIINAVLWWVCTAGGDQTAIQRFMATRDVRAARRSFLTNALTSGAVTTVLILVGFALLGYFQSDGSRLPDGMSISGDADGLLPYFVSHHMPAGLSGVVICGLFAAAMSSVDSGVNSITAVFQTDFVERCFKRVPAGSGIATTRWLAFTIGMIVILFSSFVLESVPGNFLEQAFRTFGLLITPMFLLFVFALFIPFGNQIGAILGALAGLSVGVVVAYWNPLTGLPMVSFQWIFPASLVTGLTVGCFCSLLTGGRRDPRP